MGSYWGFRDMEGYDDKVPFYVQFVPPKMLILTLIFSRFRFTTLRRPMQLGKFQVDILKERADHQRMKFLIRG